MTSSVKTANKVKREKNAFDYFLFNLHEKGGPHSSLIHLQRQFQVFCTILSSVQLGNHFYSDFQFQD